MVISYRSTWNHYGIHDCEYCCVYLFSRITVLIPVDRSKVGNYLWFVIPSSIHWTKSQKVRVERRPGQKLRYMGLSSGSALGNYVIWNKSLKPSLVPVSSTVPWGIWTDITSKLFLVLALVGFSVCLPQAESWC